MAERNKVLVVDDDPYILKILRLILEREGFVVEQAATGHEAVLVNRRFLPDLIIMDLVLPDIDGAEAIARIMRSAEEDNRPKVFFISGVISSHDALSNIITIYDWKYKIIAKPLDLMKIVETVKEMLQ
ncbi:MAG TPA: response regulator [Candidatus Omnitrophota bacterium]|nr:response regulator [Candidatus Omnitrophota bacterium]HPB68837.1 response regulator [Candidatus Omnitrophota bacterium]HQO57756.1 response regulator [Candidatus Omnitrophota bacterium]HQP11632.1 response regulator [Candidatus Omnitrophota bacterium]